MTESEQKWIKTNKDACAVLRQLHDMLALSSLPPRRTWVGLTEDEVDEIYAFVQEEVNKHWDKGGTTMMFPFTLYKAIEQALKERNT